MRQKSATHEGGVEYEERLGLESVIASISIEKGMSSVSR